MSIEAMAIALHHSRASGTAKLVLLGIASHDGDGGSWPSRATLAKYAGVREQGTVRRAVNQLIELHEIRRHVNAGGTADRADYLRPNRYEFLLECPPFCDRTSQHRDTRRATKYLPRYLSIPELDDPEAEQDRGAERTPPPGAHLPPPPGAEPPPELNQLNHPGESSGSGLNAGARASMQERYAAEIDRLHGGRGLIRPEPQPTCPTRLKLPCSRRPDGTCLDCGLTAEQLAEYEQLALELTTQAEAS